MKIVIVRVEPTNGDYLKVFVEEQDRSIGQTESIDPITQEIVMVDVHKQFEIDIVPFTKVDGIFTRKTTAQISTEIMNEAIDRYNAFYAQLDALAAFPEGTILYEV